MQDMPGITKGLLIAMAGAIGYMLYHFTALASAIN